MEKIEIKGINYRLNEETLTAEVIEKEYEGDIIIPETVVFQEVAYRVTSIRWSAFLGCKSLTSIVIPDSVTRIIHAAFYECKSLTSITFNGTKAQWQGIKLGRDWNTRCPGITVHCTDGEVAEPCRW